MFCSALDNVPITVEWLKINHSIAHELTHDGFSPSTANHKKGIDKHKEAKNDPQFGCK